MDGLTHGDAEDRDAWGRGGARPPLPAHARRWLQRHVGLAEPSPEPSPEPRKTRQGHGHQRPEHSADPSTGPSTGPSTDPSADPSADPFTDRALAGHASGVAVPGTDTSGVTASDADAHAAGHPTGDGPDDHGLNREAHDDLVRVVGSEQVRTDRHTRSGHAGGLSYLDLLRRRQGRPVPLPDAVVLPGSHDEVVELLRTCSRHDVAVVPFGGGTSVVGGVEALRCGHRAVVAVDLARMDRLLAVDTESLTATLQPGLTGPAVERLLGRHGLTLGHFPQSHHRATVGGYAATRSAGQASTGYGRFDQMVVGVRLATPVGELQLGRAPMSAAGPDLRQLVLGSEGAFGIVTEVTVRVRRAPRQRRYEAWSLGSFEAGTRAVRTLVQDGLAPDVTRLSDADETAVTFALAGPTAGVLAARLYLRARGQRHPCLLVLGWEGSTPSVRARRAAAARVLRRCGAVHLGQGPGRAWRRGRFDAPFLRDTLLDTGLIVETLETAAPWSGLHRVRAETADALRHALHTGRGVPLVTCHLSHAYPTGASLYFTAVASSGGADPAEQWSRAKRAATDTIVRAGGTLSHHHGVGLDHAPWLAAEVGELGVEVLRAVKRRLDPRGICNPGKLVRVTGATPSGDSRVTLAG